MAMIEETFGSRGPTQRRSFKVWLRDKLDMSIKRSSVTSVSRLPPSEPIGIERTSKFHKSFEGWNLRLHKAVGGHVVEAYRYNNGPYINNQEQTELFLVPQSDDMSQALNDILIQLMLRG